MTVHIDSSLDGGNIRVVRIAGNDIDLEIRKDAGGEFCQWFYFRMTGQAGMRYRLNIVNAGASSYPAGWEDYRAGASYDRKDWFRLPTGYDGQTLSVDLKLERDAIFVSYFAPYSREDHEHFVARSLHSPHARLQIAGHSVEGRPIDLLTIGAAGRSKAVYWVIARQHPGEPMASWFIEGMVQRLLDGSDLVSQFLLQEATFYVVPNMNPDGSHLGYLRTNAVGMNLNRQWSDPDPERSPEVCCVRNKMRETGVDFLLDVHGDEARSCNFVIDALGVPSATERQARLCGMFRDAWRRASADFENFLEEPRGMAGGDNLGLAANYVAETFGCLAVTLEQPFKDNAATPDERAGWSPQRCVALGRSSLEAIAAIVKA